MCGVYKQSQYGDVMLPLTVLRRLDYVLEHRVDQVKRSAAKYSNYTEELRVKELNKEVQINFHNTSGLTFQGMLSEPGQIAANLKNYINAFPKDIREVFVDQILKLA